jgi:hypothetical protein
LPFQGRNLGRRAVIANKATFAIPRVRPRLIAVWLRDYQLNHFGGLSGRLSGFSGIRPIGIALVQLKSRQKSPNSCISAVA